MSAVPVRVIDVGHVRASAPLLGLNPEVAGSDGEARRVAKVAIVIGSVILVAGVGMAVLGVVKVVNVPGEKISDIKAELLLGAIMCATGIAMIAVGCCKKGTVEGGVVLVHPSRFRVPPPAGSRGYTSERVDAIRELRKTGHL